MNRHATCAFSEYCHFARITSECCDVLLDPAQRFSLVLQAKIAGRCVVSSAQESLGEVTRNYVEIFRRVIFFSDQNCLVLCAPPHFSKIPALIQASSFYKPAFLFLPNAYSQIPVKSDVLNCHWSCYNVQASGRGCITEVLSLNEMTTDKDRQNFQADNYTVSPHSLPQIRHGITWKGYFAFTVKLPLSSAPISTRSHLCKGIPAPCIQSDAFCLIYIKFPNLQLIFGTGNVFRKVNWEQTALIKRT